MISKKEVQHIAELARIGVTKSEIEILQKDLSSVLKYVAILTKVDVSDIEPTSHPFKIENVMRSDEARSESKKILSGFLKVKHIF